MQAGCFLESCALVEGVIVACTQEVGADMSSAAHLFHALGLSSIFKPRFANSRFLTLFCLFAALSPHGEPAKGEAAS